MKSAFQRRTVHKYMAGSETLAELLAARRSRKKPFDHGPYHDGRLASKPCANEELRLRERFFVEEDKRIHSEVEGPQLYLLRG